MAKDPKQRYVLNLKLETEKFQEDILNKRFEIGRQLYNSVLGKALSRYNEMTKTKRWRENQANMSEIYKVEKDKKKAKILLKSYYDIKKDMLKEFRLSEYSLHEDIKLMQHKFKKNIDSFTAQKIASRVWTALNDNLFGKGEKVHFKNYNQGLNSLEGKSNTTGIKYIEDKHTLEWNNLSIKVQTKLNDYETTALKDKICYCRIKRIYVRGKYKYILQLILDGMPPIKMNKETGEIKNPLGIGTIGIDIGTQTLAYVSDKDIKLYELAPRIQNIEKEKRKIQRYMDRSKRAMNHHNFNEDGTIKHGVKLKWNHSKKYIKAKDKLKDIHRKQADIRKTDHNIMVNNILSKGDTVLVETMNYKGLQAKAKETTRNPKSGKINKKKRFGKSLANKAPAMFLTILKNKLAAKDGRYLEVNTHKIKASQYNHLNQEYNKKKLSQRWNYFEYEGSNIKVQRDIYSAYLIKNVNEDLETIDNDKCIKDFDDFLKLHNEEIEKLKEFNNLSSIGI